ncbi:transcriptional regulator [Algimonas ampicilliniresistens]|uniref:Transcriptional regulator n=1 Tax=Algimonas ampicilliniresistens TaxID=1298735 RepID=A0ABQ5VCB0_9PROT|nr:helix-turn-helix transcriptional regulator [Algimonas ampicilliniresistens]GLQ25166.1 transcriptional regulator [Algimonas ampicilliniresistens]
MNTSEDMDLVFQALAHRTRRDILDLLRAEPGQAVGHLASNFDVSRINIINHLRVLETAGLVISEKDGRSRRLYLNLMPIQMVYDRWTDRYSGYWSDRLASLKYGAEQATKLKGTS